MKFRLSLIIVIFAAIFFSSCNSGDPNAPNNENLTISAAVSLKDAFTEIGELYKSKTGKNVNFNFGASGTLQRQIETGAPVDVFASAGEKQLDELAAKNLIEKESRRDFARNTLVLIVPKNSGNTFSGFEILAETDIKKIAVGNPKTVPAGQYAEEVFEKTNLKKQIQNKLIPAEDVRQVLDYVARGEVDVGVVYKTDALIAGDKVDIITTAPENTHSPILYPIALLQNGKQKSGAKEFITFVLSADGQKILQKYGFSNAAGK